MFLRVPCQPSPDEGAPRDDPKATPPGIPDDPRGEPTADPAALEVGSHLRVQVGDPSGAQLVADEGGEGRVLAQTGFVATTLGDILDAQAGGSALRCAGAAH